MQVELVYIDGGSRTMEASRVDAEVQDGGGSVRIDGEWHHGIRDIHVKGGSMGLSL